MCTVTSGGTWSYTTAAGAKATLTFTGGFTFTFAGTKYSSVRVLANGGLQFGADTGFMRNYTNSNLPAGNATAQSGCAAGATTVPV